MRILNSIVVLILAAVLLSCTTQERLRVDIPSLESELQTLIGDFDGKVGIYVQHLGTGDEIAINADELYPTASMIKVPIMAALFHRLENPLPNDSLTYHSKLTWYDSLVNYPGDDGIMASHAEGAHISLDKVVSLMITYSDNNASLWCQELAGGGLVINAWLADNGFEKTRVNSRTPDRQDDWEIYGWGQTTPREMAELVVMIREGRAVNEKASEEMYRAMTKIYWDDEALAPIPMTVQAASKQGAVSASRSEVVLVNAPHGDYVFCVITKEQADTSWADDNPGFVLLRDVSRLLWNTFEG